MNDIINSIVNNKKGHKIVNDIMNDIMSNIVNDKGSQYCERQNSSFAHKLDGLLAKVLNEQLEKQKTNCCSKKSKGLEIWHFCSVSFGGSGRMLLANCQNH